MPGRDDIQKGYGTSLHLVRSVAVNGDYSALAPREDKHVIVFMTDNLGRSLSLHIPKHLARAMISSITDQLAAIDAPPETGEVK